MAPSQGAAAPVRDDRYRDDFVPGPGIAALDVDSIGSPLLALRGES